MKPKLQAPRRAIFTDSALQTKYDKAGINQKFIYKSLVEHSGWHAGCGWIWGNYSQTVRLLDSLVERGLAIKEARTGHRPSMVKRVDGNATLIYQPYGYVLYKAVPSTTESIVITAQRES